MGVLMGFFRLLMRTKIHERNTNPNTMSEICIFCLTIGRFGVLISGIRNIKAMNPYSMILFALVPVLMRLNWCKNVLTRQVSSIFQVPNVTIRDVTERPETLECGSNVLSGVASETILDIAQMALELPHSWPPPSEYLVCDVSLSVTKILLGFRLTAWVCRWPCGRSHRPQTHRETGLSHPTDGLVSENQTHFFRWIGLGPQTPLGAFFNVYASTGPTKTLSGNLRTPYGHRLLRQLNG